MASQIVELDQIPELVSSQHRFFATGKTLSREFRVLQLKLLEKAVRGAEKAILDALESDLRKPRFEGYIGEYWFTLEEIRYASSRLKCWMRPKRVGTTLLLLPGRSEIRTEPKGVVLILGPWNYPLQLMLSPLVAAIAAGNCAILKPSEFAPATSRVVRQLIADTFPSEYIACVEGAAPAATELLDQRFDHIFFTGGATVGRVVMAAAVKHLTPVTLELGGKSPCIVDADIDLMVAARRIAWGKFFNSGQTCVAPDYLLISRQKKTELVAAIRETLLKMFGPNPSLSPDLGRIVNERHYHRLKGLMGRGKIVVGGEVKPDQLFIAPTLLEDISDDDPIMSEEIFGPILPIRVYDHIDEAIAFVRSRPKPLALYLFSRDRAVQRRVLDELSFGGGCVNDTLLHLNNPRLPFGGVGESGMGAYHGESGYLEFSHRKSIVIKSFWGDMAVRYPPYGKRLEWLRKWLK